MKRHFQYAALALLAASSFSVTALAEDPAVIEEEYETSGAQAAGFTLEQYEEISEMPEFPTVATAFAAARTSLTTNQQKVVDYTKQQLGKGYVWGGVGPDAFDCSGLTQYVYQNAVGISLPRITTDQEKVGTEVSLSELQPGDLLFFGSRGATYHTAIYIGDGKFIHAAESGAQVKVTEMQYYAPDFARRLLTDGGNDGNDGNDNSDSQMMYRLLNANSGEHFYTASSAEKDGLVQKGWTYEGVAWSAPNSGEEVYRLYNPNTGAHHYTKSAEERDGLVTKGWTYEAVSWYSDTAEAIPLYRAYNPNAKVATHHYTASESEFEGLIEKGWRDEGVAWHGVS